jgi:sulfatase modifying factor 1
MPACFDTDTRASASPAPSHAEEHDRPPTVGAVHDMVWIEGGEFLMGSEAFYPEEAPSRRTSVDCFWIDRHAVTAADFRRFVRETSYVTVAERPLDPDDYPDADPELLVPGSLVFRKTAAPVPLNDVRSWWEYVPGAFWKKPGGPGTTINGRDRHPAVQVAYEDANAYAAWSGKALPTEAEWEYAARGGLDGAAFAWGDDQFPDGKAMANTWQGEFPWQNLNLDGFEGTSPVGSFPPNGYGLYDMTGNTWEWTSDDFASTSGERKACCAPELLPGERFPRKVIKGGSHLCAPNYCLRYRPAARQGETTDTSTGHIGFRCVVRTTPGT